MLAAIQETEVKPEYQTEMFEVLSSRNNNRVSTSIPSDLSDEELLIFMRNRKKKIINGKDSSQPA